MTWWYRISLFRWFWRLILASEKAWKVSIGYFCILQEVWDRILRHVGQDRCPSLYGKQQWIGNRLRKIFPCLHTLNHWSRRFWYHSVNAPRRGIKKVNKSFKKNNKKIHTRNISNWSFFIYSVFDASWSKLNLLFKSPIHKLSSSSDWDFSSDSEEFFSTSLVRRWHQFRRRLRLGWSDILSLRLVNGSNFLNNFSKVVFNSAFSLVLIRFWTSSGDLNPCMMRYRL